MFNQNIKNSIEETINQYEQNLNTKNEMIDFFRKFLSENSFYGVNSVEDLNLVDLFITSFCKACQDKKFSFEEIKDIAYKNKEVFTELNSAVFESLIKVVSYSSSEIDFDEVSAFFKKENKPTLDLNKIFIADEKLLSLITLAGFEKKHNGDILPLVKLTSKYSEEVNYAVSLVYAAIELKEIIEMYTDDLSLYKDILNLKMSEKNSSKTIREKIKGDYDISEYETYMIELREYCLSLSNAEKAKQKEYRRQINNYRAVLTWMDKIEQQNTENLKPISIDPSIMKISSENIKLEVLKSIYSHNLEITQKLNSKYQDLSNNSKNNYKKVLKKYNIVVDENEMDFNMNVADLEKVLLILKKINITNSKSVLRLIKSTNLNDMTELHSYINRGLFNSQFVLDNIEVFSNHDLFSSLQENIKYLQTEKISTTYIQKMGDVLLEKPELLRQNISILTEYSLLKNYKNADNYNFLKSTDLAEKIDIMLELGYEKNLEENLALLDYSKDDYKKLEILKRLNIPLSSTEEIEKALNNPYYTITDNNLDNYISDFANYVILDGEEISKEKFIEKLEENKDNDSTSRLYSFQGMFISKNKLKREMNKVEKENLTVSEQFQCLTKNKLLRQEDYFKIKNLISSNKVSDTVKVKK